MKSKRFTVRNESFQCDFCKKQVPPAASGCRNHCPYCLHSKHVDIYPGDRANPCGGLLKPLNYELSAKKGVVIVFQCEKCAAMVRNKALLADKIVADDYQALLAITQT